MDAFEVLESGLFTTIQDRGRFGFQKYGVPVAGAMDEASLRIANILVDNPEGAAALEITAIGPSLQALADLAIAIAGGDLSAYLDGKALPRYQAILVRKGQTLVFEGPKSGFRAYLAIAGGIDVPPILGSRSTYFPSRLGGLEGRPLKKGDVIKIDPIQEPFVEILGRKPPPEFIPYYGDEWELLVVLGPQDDRFTNWGIKTLLDSTYVITPDSDRMGYRLEGPPIAHKGSADVLSDSIPLGAVQVPGDGQPIVMMVDRQTTGGYPKIATLLKESVVKLAQAKPGDRVRFRDVGIEEAHQRFREYEERLAQIKEQIEIALESRIYYASISKEFYENEESDQEDIDARPPKNRH